MLQQVLDDLKDWKGSIEIDGTEYATVDDARKHCADTESGVQCILLHSQRKHAPERNQTRFSDEECAMYRVTVRQYMTKKSSPGFDFMAQWNNDNPMPLRTMVGTVEKETRGMVYMKLHGDITSRLTQCCMRCGRAITNPVSQFFGMGPECGGHNYTNPFESEAKLKSVVEDYRRNYLQKIVWEGWIIKSAILEQEKLTDIG